MNTSVINFDFRGIINVFLCFTQLGFCCVYFVFIPQNIFEVIHVNNNISGIQNLKYSNTNIYLLQTSCTLFLGIEGKWLLHRILSFDGHHLSSNSYCDVHSKFRCTCSFFYDCQPPSVFRFSYDKFVHI